MSITIGARSLATSRPADLDDRLVAATGCTAAEHVAMLGPTCTAYQLARALRPLLTEGDAGDLGELATAIAEGGNGEAIRHATIALLSATEPEPTPAPPSADGRSGE